MEIPVYVLTSTVEAAGQKGRKALRAARGVCGGGGGGGGGRGVEEQAVSHGKSTCWDGRRAGARPLGSSGLGLALWPHRRWPWLPQRGRPSDRWPSAQTHGARRARARARAPLCYPQEVEVFCTQVRTLSSGSQIQKFDCCYQRRNIPADQIL
ncbi:Protein of unknown function [Gryllus bimaculatus]|nr:Protein of unknown function [Gryllus bimaculatus]